jgi:methylmalonyl-CoA mutase N-terminal domain/subunit
MAGVAIDTVEDMKVLFGDIPLDKVPRCCRYLPLMSHPAFLMSVHKR